MPLTKVEVRGVKFLERRLKSCCRIPLVGVIKLRGQEDLLPWHTRRLDPLSDFCLVLVPSGSVDVLVSILQGKFNGVFDLAWLRLPCAYIQEHSGVRT